jgi:hypothetical protein
MSIEYKGFLITPNRLMPTCYGVATAGQGGKIPKVLESLFTSPSLAKFAIDDYIELKESKGQKNGKTNSESGD